MSPSAIHPETTEELINHGINKTIEKTAHSLKPMANGTSPHLPELDASKLIFIRNENPKAVPAFNAPEVWTSTPCSDHMVTCNWTATTGWASPKMEPYGPFQIMPTSSCLHYATQCFEGMKLYRGYDGKLRIFRPDLNCARMVKSSVRIALPAFPPTELQKLIVALCAKDGTKWLPKDRPGTFLYIRPAMIANGATLGVQKPTEAMLFILLACFPNFEAKLMATPSSSSNGVSNGITSNGQKEPEKKPGMKLLASQSDTIRAWPGGFGHAKVGANYGPTLVAQGEARARGYDQVLWLFGSDGFVTEAGASNFFIIWKSKDDSEKLELVTAPLDDRMILDGVTRRSVLEMARKWVVGGELEVVERKFTMDEVFEAVEEGRVVEAFAAGTAFFIASVSEIHFRGKDLAIPMVQGATGKFAGLFRTWLKDIMYGRMQHEWGFVIPEES